ncbi:chymase-like isoform X1 [Sphaeramia orbicularis]|uniref:trypsin n=1 Tax=Sphaeramia orbicularis TaxID=375764 RepID=A0A672YX76_9TELE|nr:chymase-like isoform X1 [Sphaeramia orbicularis]
MHNRCELVIFILAMTVHTEAVHEGREAVPHSRPYMVLVEKILVDGITTYCGGFLLNEHFVMTSATCDARSYRVFLGLHSFYNQKNVQIIDVENAFPHPDFDSKDFKHNIMLLELKSKVTLNSNVRPVDVADDFDPAPKSCIISGWGFHVTASMATYLREVSVTLLHSMSCKMDESYCSEGEQGPGEADAGAPLVCENGKAYGVVSATYVDTQGGLKVHHYTKILDYRDWIESIMTTVSDTIFKSYWCGALKPTVPEPDAD